MAPFDDVPDSGREPAVLEAWAAGPQGVQRLEALAREEADRYFHEVLPRFIDAHYRGAGYELLARMLEAHDHRNLSADASAGAPSEKARRMAKGTRDACPLALLPVELLKSGGSVVLGRFHATSIASGLSVRTTRSVEIFLGSFQRLGLATETDLRRQLFETIFHEYVHHFESYLLKSEQPLRAREQDVTPRPAMSVEEARRRDRGHTLRRVLGWGALAAVAVSSAVVVGLTGVSSRSQREEAMDRQSAAAEPSARERVSDAALLRRLAQVVAERQGPEAAEASAGVAPFFRDDRGASLSTLGTLIPDPDVPGAVPFVFGAAVTMYWLYDGLAPDGASAPTPGLHLVGVAWTATGGPVLLHTLVVPEPRGAR